MIEVLPVARPILSILVANLLFETFSLKLPAKYSAILALLFAGLSRVVQPNGSEQSSEQSRMVTERRIERRGLAKSKPPAQTLVGLSLGKFSVNWPAYCGGTARSLDNLVGTWAVSRPPDSSHFPLSASALRAGCRAILR